MVCVSCPFLRRMGDGEYRCGLGGAMLDEDALHTPQMCIGDTLEEEAAMRRNGKPAAFTSLEQAAIKRVYGKVDTRHIANLLHCKPDDVRRFAHSNGLIPRNQRAPVWRPTPRQVEMVRELYARCGAKGLAQRFGVKYTQVRSLARRLGVTSRKSPDWTPDEETRLRELAPTTTRREIARTLGRTLVGVGLKMRRLGLRQKEGWTLREVCRMTGIHRRKTVEDIAAGLLAGGTRVVYVDGERGWWQFSPEAVARYVVQRGDVLRVDIERLYRLYLQVDGAVGKAVERLLEAAQRRVVYRAPSPRWAKYVSVRLRQRGFAARSQGKMVITTAPRAALALVFTAVVRNRLEEIR